MAGLQGTQRGTVINAAGDPNPSEQAGFVTGIDCSFVVVGISFVSLAFAPLSVPRGSKAEMVTTPTSARSLGSFS